MQTDPSAIKNREKVGKTSDGALGECLSGLAPSYCLARRNFGIFFHPWTRESNGIGKLYCVTDLSCSNVKKSAALVHQRTRRAPLRVQGSQLVVAAEMGPVSGLLLGAAINRIVRDNQSPCNKQKEKRNKKKEKEKEEGGVTCCVPSVQSSAYPEQTIATVLVSNLVILFASSFFALFVQSFVLVLFAHTMVWVRVVLSPPPPSFDAPSFDAPPRGTLSPTNRSILVLGREMKARFGRLAEFS